MGVLEPAVRAAAVRIARLSLVALSGLACDDVLGIESPRPLESASAVAGGGSEGDEPPNVTAAPVESGGRGPNARDEGAAGDIGADAGAGGDAGAQSSGGAASQVQLLISGAETTICPGEQAELSLSTGTGQAPYVWSLLDAEPGFAISASPSGTARATLSGAPTTAGPHAIRVRVTDNTGRRGERTLTVSVRDTPVIVKPTLLSACPNQVYDVPLSAEGGDTSNYRWSSDLPESTGLRIDGASLRGKFLGASGASHLNFTVNLQDGGSCPVAPLAVSLDVESATATVCAEVDVSSAAPDAPLPAPCTGTAYSEPLIRRRGVGPFQWTAIATPPGLTFDGSTQVLAGKASVAGPLTVQVLDESTNRVFERSFDVNPRQACWLAYVSTETGKARLNLFDPVLGSREHFPPDSVSDPVTDFKFSPDGRYLAYRLGDPAGLYVMKLPSRAEQRLAMSGVAYYDWAPDSATLAIVYDAAGDSMIAGAQVNLGIEDPNAAAISFPPPVSTAMQFASEPVWVNATKLAFLQDVVDPFLFLSTSDFSSSVFLRAKQNVDILFADTQLRPAANGVFAVPSEDVILYYGNDGSLPVQHGDVVIAPSGRYTARAGSHSLSLFRATDDSSDPAGAAHDALAGCDTILAWAGSRELIACSEQTLTPEDNLRIFEVDPGTDLFEPPPSAAVDLTGFASPKVLRRRAFSASGARFAFSGDDTLSVVTFDAGPPKTFEFALEASSTAPNNAFAELSFSPNERYVLQHRGQRLSVFDLNDPSTGEVRLSDALSPSLACVENFRDEAVGWCGAARPDAPFSWAPNSDFAAFQSAGGALQLSGVAAPQLVRVDQCTTACVAPGQFAFQP